MRPKDSEQNIFLNKFLVWQKDYARIQLKPFPPLRQNITKLVARIAKTVNY